MSLAAPTLNISGLSCNEGYTGEVAYVPCTEDRGNIGMTGCSEIQCSMPRNTDGYDVSRFDDQVDDVRWTTFDVSSIRCDSSGGFTGNARVERCDRYLGGDFELSGCVRSDSKSTQVEMNLDIVVRDTNDDVEMNAIQQTLELSMENALNLHSGSVTTTSFVRVTQRRRVLSSSETFAWTFDVTYSSTDVLMQESLDGLADGSSSDLIDEFANEVEMNAETNSDVSSQDSTAIRTTLSVQNVAHIEGGDDSTMLIVIAVCALVGLAVMVIGVRFVFSSSKASAESPKNRVVPQNV